MPEQLALRENLTIEELEKLLAKAKAAKVHKPNPYLAMKRRKQLENYVISEGQVPNPDPTDWRKPACTPAEAREIEKRMKKRGKEPVTVEVFPPALEDQK